MSATITIKVDADDVLKKYAGMEKKISEALETALAKGALIVQGEAKRNAPVDTGRLRQSIVVYSDQKAVSKSIVATTFYAIYQELGTRYFTGRFYMQDARDTAEPVITQIFNEEVAKAIQ
jgi:HK97 gp10 family phage protein